MAIRQTTPKRRRKEPELTKEQVAANWNKWFKENQERWGLDPIVLTRPGWDSGRTEWPEYPPNPPKIKAPCQQPVPDDSPLRQRTEWPEYPPHLSKKERQARAAASGEPFVVGLPTKFEGQLTVTVGGCWKWHGKHKNGRPVLGRYVYRRLFAALRGRLEPGKHLHHECRRGWCANPWHTEQMLRDEHSRLHTRPHQRILDGSYAQRFMR